MKQAKCKRLPVDADPMRILETHEQKMNRKAGNKHKPRAKIYKVTANLSKRHKNYGKHPSQAY